MKATAVLVILMLALASYAQKKSSAPKPKPAPKAEVAPKPESAPKAEKQNVYYQTWDEGEVKSCSTYSGQTSLLICDDTKLDWKGSFLNLIGESAGAGLNEEEAYHRAFLYALTHSKTFLVSFSEDPWPKPQTGRKLAGWDCSKDKIITCTVYGREK